MIEIREAIIDEDIVPFYIIYCQNILFTRSRKEPTWFEHCNWWHSIFDKEVLYSILLNNYVIGYIRIIKDTKEISIALYKELQNKGLGSQALELLKEKPLLARVHKSNKRSLHFFNKNNIPIEVIE